MYQIIYSNFFNLFFKLILLEDLEDENPHTKKEHIKKEILSARKRTPKIMPKESPEMSDNIEHSTTKNRNKSACSVDQDSIIDIGNPDMVETPLIIGDPCTEWLKTIPLYKKLSPASLILLLFVVLALILTTKDSKFKC